MAQVLDEYEESVTEYFDIYYHSHDMVVSVDTETEKVLQCNKAVMETLDYSRAEIVGTFHLSVVSSRLYSKMRRNCFVLSRRPAEYTTPNRRCGKEMGEKSM